MTDVLVIGAGPAGSAAASWLARHGHDVVVVERRDFPRSKACGDIITPRAVRQLNDLGLVTALQRWHRLDGLLVTSHGRSRQIPWPQHHELPGYALTARRRELDVLIADTAAASGATMLFGHEAIEPIIDRGFVRGAVVRSALGSVSRIEAKYLIVADGANSVFGRSLGTFRNRGWPYGTAVRSYWRSPRHDEAFIETCFDLTDRADVILPGYGWVAPLGDGTVNVGAGLLSSARDFKGTNVVNLLDDHVANVAERWGLDVSESTGVLRVGRIPMGGSVLPTAGPTYLVVGDAAALASPLTGAGIETALESARLAADVLHEAIVEGTPTTLQRYPQLLGATYAEHNKMARLFARLVGRPRAMRQLAHGAVRSRALAELLTTIMTGSLRSEHKGPAEATDRLLRTVIKMAPDA